MKLGAVVGSVYSACGYEYDITGRNVIGSVLDEIVALALPHIIELEHAVIMLGSNTAPDTLSFIEIVVSVIGGK